MCVFVWVSQQQWSNDDILIRIVVDAKGLNRGVKDWLGLNRLECWEYELLLTYNLLSLGM